MENQNKPVRVNAYAILDNAGNWSKHKVHGFYLVYDTEEQARDGLNEHGGATIIRVKLYYDNTADKEIIS